MASAGRLVLRCAIIRNIRSGDRSRISRARKNSAMRKSLFVFTAVVSFIGCAQAQTATDILAKVSSVYAGCRTYSDEGLTSTTEGPPAGGRRSYFRTAFVRPNAFRVQLWVNSERPGGVKPWTIWTN